MASLLLLLLLVASAVGETQHGPCRQNSCTVCNATTACGTCPNGTLTFSVLHDCLYGICTRCFNNLTQVGPGTSSNDTVGWANVQVGVCTYFWSSRSSVTCATITTSKPTTSPPPTLSDGAVAGVLLGMLGLTALVIAVVVIVKWQLRKRRERAVLEVYV